jgi:heme/copper-type cytochrome/quinol oxidase subunit 2
MKWNYRSLAWVTPGQAGWVFCGSALLTIFLIFLSIYGDNTNYFYTHLALVMLPIPVLAGIFGLLTWLIDKYDKDEENRIQSRYYLHISVFIAIIWMAITFARFALK